MGLVKTERLSGMDATFLYLERPTMHMHHAMTDGIAGMQIASVLFDLAPDGAVPTGGGLWTPTPAPSEAEMLRDAVIDQVEHPVEALLRAAEAPVRVADVLARTAAGVRD